MQIKLFTIPAGDSGGSLDELNRFLRGNKVLEVQNELVRNANGSYWCFCVRYIEKSDHVTGDSRKKVDYRQILDGSTFKKFAELRAIRKKVAAEERVPAFIVFTDEELAGLAKLDKITGKSMLSVKGIGDKKVERYLKYLIHEPEKNETPGKSD